MNTDGFEFICIFLYNWLNSVTLAVNNKNNIINPIKNKLNLFITWKEKNKDIKFGINISSLFFLFFFFVFLLFLFICDLLSEFRLFEIVTFKHSEMDLIQSTWMNLLPTKCWFHVGKLVWGYDDKYFAESRKLITEIM